jgi:hypothetical protein
VGLTDDQKAMLRLLAQREEGYEDMAALMGISVEEVRERVKEALAEVDEPPPGDDPQSGMPPAPEPPPAPAPPQPEPPQAAVEPSAAATPPAPAAETPAAPQPTRRSGQAPRLGLPKDRGALIGLGAGALVVVVLAIVLIVSGGEGDSSGSGPTAGEAGLAENASAAAESEDLTQAVLAPVAGGDASGRALFGRYKKNVLLQVEAEGLEPSPQGQAYTIWLYRTPKLALQIGSVPVGGSGKIAAQFQVPAQLLAYVASGAFNQVDISLTSTAAYRAELAKAKAERKLPPHVGTSVLRGEITGPAIRSAGSTE